LFNTHYQVSLNRLKLLSRKTHNETEAERKYSKNKEHGDPKKNSLGHKSVVVIDPHTKKKAQYVFIPKEEHGILHGGLESAQYVKDTSAIADDGSVDPQILRLALVWNDLGIQNWLLPKLTQVGIQAQRRAVHCIEVKLLLQL